ncbi:unnamed protein product [Ambrosiozyma monospora]|uniref:Unnamed protein product n=1 Tax=Ambrosiozyma monospora TaxID=43982 RepID=A0ACB5SRA9_AMBMO|nr:unnamed protein product [Ambrosiozyma monospora]
MTEDKQKHIYFKPEKRLRSPDDLTRFQKSETYEEILNFIQTLATSVHGLELGDPSLPQDGPIADVIAALNRISDIIEKHPVTKDTTSRFGKLEFRDFYDDLSEHITGILHDTLKLNVKEKSNNNDKGDNSSDPVIELETYLLNSFGDRTRIDYGSGHELNFASFLLCLYKLDYFPSETYNKSIVLVIFDKYMKIMRTLQTKYWLEPAGSHGVWGLDDYHFLPFLFGAAQLSPMKRPRPLTIHNKDYVEEFKGKFFYFGCIDFINQVKTGTESLRWHSPMLDDISGVKTWSKIEEGMIKMYKAEVLGKLPVVQHFMFGSLLKCPDGVEQHHSHGGEGEDDCCHEIHSTWGDCCGIKVPSAVAASLAEKNKYHIPFD